MEYPNYSARYWVHCAGMSTMSLDLDLILPIRDTPSAELMMLKATCLWNAGIIDDRQRELVHQRAKRVLRRDAAIAALWRRAHEVHDCAVEWKAAVSTQV